MSHCTKHQARSGQRGVYILFAVLALVGGVIGGATYQAAFEPARRANATATQLALIQQHLDRLLAIGLSPESIDRMRVDIDDCQSRLSELEEWRVDTDAGIEEMAGRLRGGLESAGGRIDTLEKQIAAIKGEFEGNGQVAQLDSLLAWVCYKVGRFNPTSEGDRPPGMPQDGFKLVESRQAALEKELADLKKRKCACCK